MVIHILGMIIHSHTCTDATDHKSHFFHNKLLYPVALLHVFIVSIDMIIVMCLYCCMYTAVCILLYVYYCMYTAVCILLYVYCCMYTAVCILLYVYCCMYTAVCILLYVYCCMYTAVCTLLYVYCCMYTAVCCMQENNAELKIMSQVIFQPILVCD